MISLGRKKNAIVTGLAWVCLGIALMSTGASSARAQNKWGEDNSNPGEFGLILGAGTWNCRHWLSSPAAEKEGNSWILGWWTATNNAEKHFVGSKMGGGGVLAKIRGRCKTTPYWALTNAVAEAYFQVGQNEKKPGKQSAPNR